MFICTSIVDTLFQRSICSKAYIHESWIVCIISDIIQITPETGNYTS